MGEIHNLQIMDLLLDDVIARLEFTLFDKDVAIANFEDQQTVPSPPRQHAQTINHPNSLGRSPNIFNISTLPPRWNGHQYPLQ
jgi:hypothetical protein